MAKVRNLPTTEGRELGEQLARFVDKAEQDWREQRGCVPVRCPTCAFKKGSLPNGCVSTVMDATKCLIEKVPFLCHHKIEEGTRTLCAGYLMLAGPTKKPVECPWDFSE